MAQDGRGGLVASPRAASLVGSSSQSGGTFEFLGGGRSTAGDSIRDCGGGSGVYLRRSLSVIGRTRRFPQESWTMVASQELL